MIALFRVHIQYLFSERIFYFTMSLLFGSLVFMMVAAPLEEDMTTVLFYRTLYQQAFVTEVVHFGKMIIMMYLFFLLVLGYMVHQYDVILLNRVRMWRIKCTKIAAIVFLGWLFVYIYILLFLLVGKLFFPFMRFEDGWLTITVDLLFFTMYYGILMMLLYEAMRHLFGLIVGLGLYLVTFMNGTDGIKQEAVSPFMKVLYRVGLDYSLYEEKAFSFYYPKIYYIILLLSLILLVTYLRKNADLIN